MVATPLTSPHCGQIACNRESAARGRRGRLPVPLVLVAVRARLVHRRDRVARLGTAFLEAYVAARASVLGASGNRTEDGRAAFAVLLGDGATPDTFREALSAIPQVSHAREA